MSKKKVVLSLEQKVDTALQNWSNVNNFLREASETEAACMLTKEQNGLRRLQVLIRAHSRMNKKRSMRERAEIFELVMKE